MGAEKILDEIMAGITKPKANPIRMKTPQIMAQSLTVDFMVIYPLS